ncbi:MAG: hypothetical protein JST84_33030 [Acidobacteria bacterium]|nr:hypothetical protein [Acidobacteriota bacterium]
MKKMLPFLFLISFSACVSTDTTESTNVAAAEVYQDYNINVNKENSDATATFRVAGKTGTTIDLDAPAKVELNGKPMDESKPGFLKGTTYQFSATGVVSQFQFVFTNSDGKTYQNEIGLAPIEITAKSLTFSKAQKTMIPLSRALAAGESIVLTLHGQSATEANASSLVSSGVETDSSRSAAILDPSMIKEMALGKGDVRVECSKSEKVKQGTRSGGTIQITYNSVAIPATIIN